MKRVFIQVTIIFFKLMETEIWTIYTVIISIAEKWDVPLFPKDTMLIIGLINYLSIIVDTISNH